MASLMNDSVFRSNATGATHGSITLLYLDTVPMQHTQVITAGAAFIVHDDGQGAKSEPMSPSLARRSIAR
jgi:hypothetical protein